MQYILGLDLGVASIGWAVIECGRNNNPIRIVRTGVRIFKSGTGTVSDIAAGKDESRNAARRSARLMRRNIWRRKRRVLKVYNILRNADLLPMGAGFNDTPEQRTAVIQQLDKDLILQLKQRGIDTDILPYTLRKLALDENLEPFALGRIFLHLAQRRGFLSNKKATGKKDEDVGKVKSGISDLHKAIEDGGFRTLGEYFASLDPRQVRIRQRWTGRQMFQDEFAAIWTAQSTFNPSTNGTGEKLTSELRDKLFKALFYQRPLKSQKDLIGKCELEIGHRRAATASVEAQRFRYWQKILDLKVQDVDGFYRDLTREEQDKIAIELEHTEKLTFAVIRRLLGMKERGAWKFNLETEGVKDIRGNSTSAKIGKILNEKWYNGNPDENDAIINEILQFEHEDALAKRLEKRFGFDSNTASQLAAIRLEDDHLSLSKQAIRRILPVMIEKRVRFATVRKEIYGEQFDEDKTNVLDFLPQVERDKKNSNKPFFKDAVRNPVVIRTLTETRKVVNALIRLYGKPIYGKPIIVRIELARDMKKSRKEREAIDKDNRIREKKRLDAKIAILKECGIDEPKSIDLLKWQLAEECNWMCPYTGKTITPRTLLGANPQFDIEHILPFSKSLDNSYINKTLCDIHENRHVKKNQTPFEAYQHDKQRWHEILTRVSKFSGGRTAEAKLRRFQMEEIPEEFVSRNLNDTRYISRLAGEYLGMLFGGKIDADGEQRVQVSSGGMTAFLRGEWKLNEILSGKDEKNRNDHRHHAVDAVVIACNETATIQKLAAAAERASELEIHRLFVKGGVEAPFDGFKQQVNDSIDQITVSFRPDMRVSGGLHNETNYRPVRETTEKTNDGNWKRYHSHHIRKFVTSLTTEKQINDIVDPVIRQIVMEKFQRLEGKTKKFIENDLPFMTTKDGRHIPIKKVRVRDNTTTITLGEGKVNERFVAAGGNHHLEVFYLLDKNGNKTRDKLGNERIDWKCVSLFEASQRLSRKEDVIRKSDHYEDGKTLTQLSFSLQCGEFVEATPPKESPVILRCQFISESDIQFSVHTDGRTSTEQKIKSPNDDNQYPNDYQKFRIASIKKLQEFKLRKVSVDVLGNIICPASD